MKMSGSVGGDEAAGVDPRQSSSTWSPRSAPGDSVERAYSAETDPTKIQTAKIVKRGTAIPNVFNDTPGSNGRESNPGQKKRPSTLTATWEGRKGRTEVTEGGGGGGGAGSLEGNVGS